MVFGNLVILNENIMRKFKLHCYTEKNSSVKFIELFKSKKDKELEMVFNLQRQIPLKIICINLK